VVLCHSRPFAWYPERVRTKRNKKRKHYLGAFDLPSGETVLGQLTLRGPATLLNLHSEMYFSRVEPGSCVKGSAQTGECLTLIDCRSAGTGRTSFEHAPTRYHADVFPHFVAVGRYLFQPRAPYITAAHFTATDLNVLFNDYDAFGSLIDARPVMDAVLQERRGMRPVQSGDQPQVCYFTGKTNIVRTSTVLGTISVGHYPTHTMGGSRGVSIKNRIFVSIEPREAITFDDAMTCIDEIGCFLSIAAGRNQGIDRISLTTTHKIGDYPEPIAIHPSYPWKAADKIEHHTPHSADVPLDPIDNYAEFDQVFRDWLSRQPGWRAARLRYLGCMRKGNHYDVERLVAAANMFDILPPEAVPPDGGLPIDLATTRDECVISLSKHVPSADRDAALSALGRLGKSSLPKKVAFRAAIVEKVFAGRFPDLQFIASVAVKCRNFLVHGGQSDLEFSKLEHLLPFLTDTLEFVFAASDFIEAGWDASRWNSSSHSWGHTFARYCDQYQFASVDLRSTMGR